MKDKMIYKIGLSILIVIVLLFADYKLLKNNNNINTIIEINNMNTTNFSINNQWQYIKKNLPFKGDLYIENYDLECSAEGKATKWNGAIAVINKNTVTTYYVNSSDDSKKILFSKSSVETIDKTNKEYIDLDKFTKTMTAIYDKRKEYLNYPSDIVNYEFNYLPSKSTVETYIARAYIIDSNSNLKSLTKEDLPFDIIAKCRCTGKDKDLYKKNEVTVLYKN